MTEQTAKKLILIDLWNVFMIFWHAGVNKDARWPFNETMGCIRAKCREYDFAGIMTDGGQSFRADLDPRWKKNRDEKYAGAVMQLAEVERQLAREGFHVFKVLGFEADDLIATAIGQLRSFEVEAANPLIAPPVVITIHSGDKDLLSLLEPGVVMLTTNSPQRIVRAEDVRQNKKIGVDPPKVRDLLVMADSHNGVKYFENIGPVHAARLLNQFGDLQSIIAAVDNAVPDDPGKFEVHPPSIRESIKKALAETIEGRPLIDVGVQVVTLRKDAPIDARVIFQKAEAEKCTTVSAPGSRSSTQSNDSRESPAGRPGGSDKTTIGADSSSAENASRDGRIAKAEILTRDVIDAGTVPSAPMRLPAPRWELALEPYSADDALVVAETAWKAGFWPKHGGPPGCMMLILAGRSRGITAFDALNGMHIIDGKPTFGAHLLIAMVRSSKLCLYFDLVESDEKHAIWITKRKGSKVEGRREYTIEQARNAELLRMTSGGKRGNWEKNPEDMLIKTAGSKLARATYQDITAGIVSAEEMGFDG